MGTTRSRIEPGSKVKLANYDPSYTGRFKSKEDAARRDGEAPGTSRGGAGTPLRLRLARAGSSSCRPMDTAGKDGSSSTSSTAFNPQGVQVTSSRYRPRRSAPTTFCGAFTRRFPGGAWSACSTARTTRRCSWYGSPSCSPSGVDRHYDHINEFEECSPTRAVKIVNLFLHISPDEQKGACAIRQTTPASGGSLTPGTSTARAQWSQYMAAYEDALGSAAPLAPPGTSCRQTASGSATWRFPRCSSKAIEGLTRVSEAGRGH